jgi:hypothetical protein
MPYTHSFVGVLFWSAVAYAVCQMVPRLRGRQTGLILAAAVFSHWVLDLIVHVPDLALYDGVGKIGFGLWNYRVPAFVLEIALLVGGAVWLLKTVARKGRLIAFVCVLSAVQFAGTFLVPQPTSSRGEAVMALFFYFVLALIAWWVERGEGRPEKLSPVKAAA